MTVRMAVAVVAVLLAVSAGPGLPGPADAGGMPPGPASGPGGGGTRGPGSPANVGRGWVGHPGIRQSPSPFYPPPKPYPYAIQYPYYYYRTYPGLSHGGRWVPAYWAHQWVPVYSTYQVWVPPHYDESGFPVEGHWENATVETGGYYERVWVEGYWAR